MPIKYSALELSLPEIRNAFEQKRAHIYRQRDLARFIIERRNEWGLPAGIVTNEIIKLLLENTPLRMIQFTPVNHPNTSTEVRYIWEANDPFQIALSIKPNCYLSHASACYIHRLIHRIPKQIFVNKEQSAKPKTKSRLTQEGIDKAFSATKQRSSKFAFRFEGGLELVLLSGKNTSRLEVSPIDIGTGFAVDATSIERTLIDIAVRPTYAGGVIGVQEVYKAARGKVSISRLIATLKRLDYVYPYHQTIGYYLQESNFPSADYEQLKKVGLKFDFYLTYGMKLKHYRPDWRLFVPKFDE